MTATLVLAAVLRTWHTAANVGLGNEYYTAAALSMSKDWTAFLYGSLDTGNFITMDKPAVGQWPSAILINLFGLNWATVFLPSALAGTFSVLVLGLAVREGSGGRIAALVAALALAVSPVNVAIERVNNPDALLLLVLLLATWMTLRAVRRQRLRPLLGAAALVGLGFNIKYLDAFVVLPALALVWLLRGAGPLKRRLGWLAAAGVPLLAVSASWPLLTSLVPPEQRPWIGSAKDGTLPSRVWGIISQHLNPPTIKQDTLIGQITHAFQTGEVFYSGEAGPFRLFTGVMADQVSWWLPLAMVGAVTIAYDARRRRTGLPPGLVLWSGWAVCTWAVYSFMRGVTHPYYTSLMVPALAALSAGGLVTAWLAWRRGDRYGYVALAAHVLVAAGWAALILQTTSAQRPGWLAPVVLAAGVLALLPIAAGSNHAAAVSVLTAVAALAGPLVWSAKTTNQPLQGFNPLANQEGRYLPAGFPRPLAQGILAVMEGPEADAALLNFLERNRGDAKWIVATPVLYGLPITIATEGQPVMGMGGFRGTDPVPTLAQFKPLLAAGKVRFVLVSPPNVGYRNEVSLWALKACRPVELPSGRIAAQPGGEPRPAANGTILLDCKGAA
jgi:4-amino-4-deoxy-L-arabinose transferase-like glycosyltransferase